MNKYACLRRIVILSPIALLGLIAVVGIYLYSDFLYAPYRDKDNKNEKILSFYSFPHSGENVLCENGNSVIAYRYSYDGRPAQAVFYDQSGAISRTVTLGRGVYDFCSAVHKGGDPIYVHVIKEKTNRRDICVYRGGSKIRSFSQDGLGALVHFSPKWILFHSKENKGRVIAMNIDSGYLVPLSVRPDDVIGIQKEEVWEYRDAKKGHEWLLTNILSRKTKAIHLPGNQVPVPNRLFRFDFKKRNTPDGDKVFIFTVAFEKSHVTKSFTSNRYQSPRAVSSVAGDNLVVGAIGFQSGADFYLINAQTQRAKHIVVRGQIYGLTALGGHIFFSKFVNSDLARLYTWYRDKKEKYSHSELWDKPLYVYMIQ